MNNYIVTAQFPAAEAAKSFGTFSEAMDYAAWLHDMDPIQISIFYSRHADYTHYTLGEK